MTLFDAIASGKKFRRPNSATWIEWKPQENLTFIGEDLTAKDYVLKEPEAVINRTTLLENLNLCGLTWAANNSKFLALCKSLGI